MTIKIGDMRVLAERYQKIYVTHSEFVHAACNFATMLSEQNDLMLPWLEEQLLPWGFASSDGPGRPRIVVYVDRIVVEKK